MSIGIFSSTETAAKNDEPPLVAPLKEALLELRREQLNLKNQTKENQRRLNALHETLSVRAKHYGLMAEDFGEASQGPVTNVKSVPESDSLGQKIIASLTKFGKKLLGLVKPKQNSKRKEELQAFVKDVDSALRREKPYETLTDYLNENTHWLNDGHSYPDQDEYVQIFEIAVDEALEKSPNLDFKNPATQELIKRLTALSSDLLLDDKAFQVNDKHEAFVLMSNSVARYLELACEDKNFDQAISKSVDVFKAAVPKIIYAALKYAKSQTKDPARLKQVLVDYAKKLDDYLTGIAEIVYGEDRPEAKLAKLFHAEDSGDDIELAVLNQVNDFNNEAQKDPGTVKDLRQFLKHRTDYKKKLIEDLVPLSRVMLNHFQGLNLHGSMNISGGKSVNDSNEAYSFEDKFIDIAEVIYPMITFNPINRDRSRELVAWAIKDEAKQEKVDLFIDASLFIAEPQKPELKAKFFANKQKIIYMYLIQSLSFDKTGKVTNVNVGSLTALMNAVRSAQSEPDK